MTGIKPVMREGRKTYVLVIVGLDPTISDSISKWVEILGSLLRVARG